MRAAARALLVAGVVAQAAMPAAQGRRADADAPGAFPLRGRVTDAERGAPVRGARVTITAGAGPVATVLTDARGTFEAGAPDATATIRVSKAGFVTRTMPAPPSSGRTAARPFELPLTRAGAITGQVRDTGGNPVPNIRVAVWRAAPGTTRSPAPDATTETDDRGEYRIGGLPPGAYSVRVSSRALPPGASLSVAFAEGARDARAGTGQPMPERFLAEEQQPAEVRGGETTTLDHGPVDGSRVLGVVIPPNGVVTGMVADEYGDPVEGARVELWPIAAGAGRRTIAHGVAGRPTDDTGTFRLFGIPEGTFYLAVQPPSDLTAAALAPPRRSERPSPDVPGAIPSQAVPAGRSAGRGTFAPVFYPGSPTLSGAVPLEVGNGQELSGLHVTMALVPAVRVRGVVIDSAGREGLSGAVSPAVHLPTGIFALGGVEASIDAQGRFELANLSPGDYVLQALGKGSSGARELGFEAVSVASDLSGVVIAASAGTRVSGRVSFPEGASPGGRLGLSVAPADPAFAAMLSVYTGGFVEPDRTFAISGLVGPGRFVLEGAPPGWWLRSVIVDGVDVTDIPVTFGLRDHTGVEVVLDPAGGSVDGRLDVPEPLAGIGQAVAVFPLDSSRWFYRSRHLRLVSVAANGLFRASGLPPGEYWVAATTIARSGESSHAVWQDAEFLGRLVPGARRVRVAAGAIVPVQLRPAAVPR